MKVYLVNSKQKSFAAISEMVLNGLDKPVHIIDKTRNEKLLDFIGEFFDFTGYNDNGLKDLYYTIRHCGGNIVITDVTDACILKHKLKFKLSNS